MGVHAQQLSLLELDQPPKLEPRSTPHPTRRQKTTPHDTLPAPRPHANGLPSAAASGSAAPTLLTTYEAARAASRGGRCEPGRIDVPRHPGKDGGARGDPNRGRRDTIEKHYKTREVAELLSVHEETVLRLAQCGSLRSVRVGSERRYAESAIQEFLARNIDESGNRLRIALRARR